MTPAHRFQLPIPYEITFHILLYVLLFLCGSQHKVLVKTTDPGARCPSLPLMCPLGDYLTSPGLGFPTCNTKERVGLGASEGSSERRCPEPSWYPLIARAHARLDPPDPHASVHCPRPSAALGDGGHSGHASGTTSVPPRQPLKKNYSGSRLLNF